MKINKLNESMSTEDEFFDIQDIVSEALNSIGGDMDDVTGGITSSYDEDRLLLSLYSTVDRKDARKFKKNFLTTIENALSKTRFSEVSHDENHTYAYQLSRNDISNMLGSDRAEEFISRFAMFEVCITAYGQKLEESVKGKNLTEWNEFSDDDFDDDQMHAAVYGGDSKYCKDCGTVKVYDEDGFAYCPKCNESLNEARNDSWQPPENWISHKGAWIYPAGDGYEANLMGQHFEAPTLDALKVKLRDAREHRTHFVGSEKDKQFADNIKKYGRELQEVKVFGAKAEKKLQEASYGGAYDIADDQYFTREDLEEFADEVISCIAARDDVLFDVCDLSADGLKITIGLNNADRNGEFEHSVTFRVDLRSIKYPNTLATSKYVTMIADQFRDEYRKQTEPLTEDNKLLPIEVLNPDGTPKQYDVKFMELEKVPGLLNWDVADQLEQHFRNNRLWVDELHYNQVKDCIEYDINWGDWKHEHLRSKWLLEELFKELGIVANINSHTTEEDGSDTYSAHYIVRAMGKMNEAITPPTGDDPDLSEIPQIGQEVMYRGRRTTIIDYEQDPEYGYDFLIKNPFWNGQDERFKNIWVGDQVDFIDWGPNDIGLQPPG